MPREAEFAPKPRPAQRVLTRAWRQGVAAAWLTADAVYGHDGESRRFLEANGQAYLLGVPANQPLFEGEPRSPVGKIAADPPSGAWRRGSAGEGTKGPRWYDWAVQPFGAVGDRGWQRWLAVRPHQGRPGERASHCARGPADTRREVLIGVAGARWRVEGCPELAKGDCGLGGYEARSWAGWHRHATLSLWALAVVVVIRSRAAKAPTRRKGRGS